MNEVDKKYLSKLILSEISGAFVDDEKKVSEIMEHIERVVGYLYLNTDLQKL